MKTVLIADDALFMRIMLKDILTKNGFNIIGEAENGEEVVEKYRELKPDLVLLDILMPFMDGMDATKEILKMNPDAKVVMISALGQNSYLEKALSLGAKGFITKPFSPPGVVEVLEKVLKDSESHNKM